MKSLFKALRLFTYSCVVGCAPDTGVVISEESVDNNYLAEVLVEVKSVESTMKRRLANANSNETAEDVNTTPARVKHLKVWVPTIRSTKTKELLFKDDDSRMFARFNIYTGWDKSNHFWVHNTDNGVVWEYFEKDKQWIKVKSSKANMPRGLK